MKKLKALAAAVALAIGAGSAHAALDNANNETNGSSLFLVAWDNRTEGSSNAAYVRDLGINLDAVMNLAIPGDTNSGTGPNTAWVTPGAHFEFAGDALFATTFSGLVSSAISWMVVAAENVGGTAGNPTWIASAFQSIGTISNNAINVGSNAINNFISNVLAEPCTANSCATNDLGDAWHPVSSGFGSGTLNGVFVGGNDNVGEGYDTGLDFWLAQRGAGSGIGASTRFQFVNGEDAGQWFLRSDGEVEYILASAVPLPAAVWLLMSGLLGFFAVGRRRNQAAALA